MGKLDGKVAIVTGGARGLGRAFAHRLADLGAKLAVTDLNLTSYEECEADRQLMTASSTVEEIRALGGEALGFEFDVGDREATFAMAEAVHEAWGRIDILVANAGGGRGDPAEISPTSMSTDLLEQLIRMNYHGTVNCCSAVAPYMKAQRSGKIITMASLAAIRFGGPNDGGFAHYGATKAAIIHYTRYLAQELGPYGINANCLAPGILATGRVLERLGDVLHSLPVALGRTGTPEDCAKVVEFLATDLSDYVTGVLLPVDGGTY